MAFESPLDEINRSQPHSAVVSLAHQRLAELQEDRRPYDWDGSEFGKPVGRPEQIPAKDKDWRCWLYLGGRGTGKTRAAGEQIRAWVKSGRSRLGLIAPTAADARDVMIEGESGLLAICHETDRDYKGSITGRPKYEPSKRRLVWENGAMATLYTAEEPQRLRGPQHDGLWCDELCAWKYMRDTWDMAQFGLRLGGSPQVIVSTTPKPLRLLKEILNDPSTLTTRGSTFQNEANLSPHFIEQVKRRYEGTALGKQELYAQILDEAEGALWKRVWIDDTRQQSLSEDLARTCISVDPAVTANEETSNETGIIAVGTSENAERGYVLGDYSAIYTPLGWAKAAIKAYHTHEADFILAEVNNGGDLVIQNIRNEDNTIPVRTVYARKGKFLRAEPVAALYEQGRVHHIGEFDALEDQLVQFEPLSGMPSPDRLDALVHGFTSLMIKAPPNSLENILIPGGKKVKSPLWGLGI